MTDILLDRSGDIVLTAGGDISLTESIRQAVEIRLRWILNEWRFAPEYGFPWFEDVLTKNPNIDIIKSYIRTEVMGVDGVTCCDVDDVVYDRSARTARFTFRFSVGEDTYKEEVDVSA